jgi:uncharacterized protein
MSTQFRTRFTNSHVLLPVIHVESEHQALRNALLARESGCDGVFLINHSISQQQLLDIYAVVRSAAPGFWLGVNCLGLDHPLPLFVDDRLDGIWVDNAGIDELTTEQSYGNWVCSARRQHNWPGLYFGGVAFKYQRQVTDVAAAARIATNYMDVVTTSGPGTGSAADVDKIRQMKTAIGDFPLAIASGITPENVASYLPFADCFLVATGISQSFTELDPRLLDCLVARVRSAVSN